MTQSPSALIAHEPFELPHPPRHTVSKQSQVGVPLHAAGSAAHDGGGSGPQPGQPAGHVPLSGGGQKPPALGSAQYFDDPHAAEQSCVVVCCG